MAKLEYKNRKYTVELYNPKWKKCFEKEAQDLRLVFSNKIICIEHIGSTAILGLAGKPTIDILIIMQNIEIADDLSEKIESLGYKNLGDYINKGSRLFAKESNGERAVNLHVFPVNHPHAKKMIDLKNYFLSHPNIVKEYGNLKIKLFKKYPNDYELYRKFKDEWMSDLLEKIIEL